MSLETLPGQHKLEIESAFEGFVPQEFRDDPFGYFVGRGINVKSGEPVYKESGDVGEDPTAVKDLPTWKNNEGEELPVVAKKVNVDKSQVGKSKDPFHEYRIMQAAQAAGLPAARPVAKVEKEGSYLIVMEKIKGLRWTDRDAAFLRAQGYTEGDIQRLTEEATVMMEELRQKYDQAGLRRTWKLKDMVFDLDIDTKALRSITPTDWERTVIDENGPPNS